MHKAVKPRQALLFFVWSIAVITTSVMFTTEAVAAMGWITPKKSAIRVRLLMELPRVALTTAARNPETFVAERELPHGARQLIKLSYEYLYYEPPLAQEPLNEQVIYRLRAVRDHSCDETLGAMAKDLGLGESSVAHATETVGSDIPLACYRTTPRDYMSAHNRKRTNEAVQ